MTLLLTGCAASREPFAGSCVSVSSDADKIYAKLSILEDSKSLTYSAHQAAIWAAGYRNMAEYFDSFDSDSNMISILVGSDDELRASFTEAELLILDSLLEETDALTRSSFNGRMSEAYDSIVADVEAISEICNL